MAQKLTDMRKFCTITVKSTYTDATCAKYFNKVVDEIYKPH